MGWRRTLSRRTTDIACHESTGVTPLGVAADGSQRLQSAAQDCWVPWLNKGSQSTEREVGYSSRLTRLPRSPAGNLLPFQRYKRAGKVAALDELVTKLQTKIPSLRLGESEPPCRSSDDAFDAVICALVARAASMGLSPLHRQSLLPRLLVRDGSFCRWPPSTDWGRTRPTRCNPPSRHRTRSCSNRCSHPVDRTRIATDLLGRPRTPDQGRHKRATAPDPLPMGYRSVG